MSVGIKSAKSGLMETAIIVIEALAIAMFVRVFFYQPFNIPSGSMKETLLIGDYIFVSKLSYGYSKYSFPFSPNLFSGRILGSPPKRGDVAVFRKPNEPNVDFIKRVIGLPGDEIQMRKGQLFINGAAIPKTPAGEFVTRGEESSRPRRIPVFEETLPNGVTYKVLDSNSDGPLDNTAPYKVPEGHYFMMGDNRDNSTDSRVMGDAGVGYVPYENFIGRADIIFFSAAVDEPGALSWSSPWRWPFDIRWSRFFTLVH